MRIEVRGTVLCVFVNFLLFFCLKFCFNKAFGSLVIVSVWFEASAAISR